VGVVLAGGLGTRIGGRKAALEVAGRPLISYGLAALREALGSEPVVVAKRDTVLPSLPLGVEVWIEPDEPRHPLTGIIHALERAGGRDVLVLAVDLPLVTAELVRELVAEAAGAAGGIAVSRAAGRVQPLCGLYASAALETLRAVPGGARLVDLVRLLGARTVDVVDPSALTNVNTAQDGRRAGEILAARRHRSGG